MQAMEEVDRPKAPDNVPRSKTYRERSALVLSTLHLKSPGEPYRWLVPISAVDDALLSPSHGCKRSRCFQLGSLLPLLFLHHCALSLLCAFLMCRQMRSVPQLSNQRMI